MKKHTSPILTDTFYHVYNRGINGETVFKSHENYYYFLLKYAKFIEPVASTYAYCLLKNHFHLLIKTKTEEEILSQFSSNAVEVQNLDSVEQISNKNVVEVQNLDNVKHTASFHISNQFAKLFNGYSQAINKVYVRTGGLFETPFRRIEINDDAYFSQMVWYIHHNPQNHRFVKDFRDYPHSSYHSHLQTKTTKLKRNEVLEWFGSRQDYVNYHTIQNGDSDIKILKIEFD